MACGTPKERKTIKPMAESSKSEQARLATGTSHLEIGSVDIWSYG